MDSVDTARPQGPSIEGANTAARDLIPHESLEQLHTGLRTLRFGAVTAVPVNQIVMDGDTPRLSGQDPDHCALLAQIEGALPPILVHESSMRVIDGRHRLTAARSRGDRTVAARLVEGSADDIFILAVRANATQGKPLTITEREWSAQRILDAYPHWSDRAIATVCGLSAKKVAQIRECATDGRPQLHSRVGRDGRVRPLSTAPGRERAARLLMEIPTASLRQVAREAGISPGTVRDVRDRLRRGDDVATRGPSPDAAEGGPDDDALSQDRALQSTDDGRAFLAWLQGHLVGEGDWSRFVGLIPASRVYLVADAARSCAASWTSFADALEARVSRRS